MSRLAWGLFASGAAALAMGAGCNAIVGIEEPTVVSVETDASPNLPSGCDVASDCPQPGNACEVRACVDRQCKVDFAPEGTLLPDSAQTARDCKKLVCLGGKPTPQADPADLPVSDSNDCTDDVCNGPNPEYAKRSAGLACGDAGTCNSAGMCGRCSTGEKACFAGNVPAACDANGTWVTQTACSGGSPVCSAGACVAQPSCVGVAACGARSCCDTPSAQGALFAMGRSASGADAEGTGAADEQPEHPTTVGAFKMETYPVTVGRFRKFVSAAPAPPASGAGEHPRIAASGWQPGWNTFLASGDTLKAGLKCSANYATWTDAVGANENRPINCVTWYEAFAFCIWDGGRLATEAEWEFVAAGGDENRKYPWGAAAPTTSLAAYGCLYDGVAGCAAADIPLVGAFPAGAGRFGHLDVAGTMGAWTLDFHNAVFYETVKNGCTDCVNLDATNAKRVVRGSSFVDPIAKLRAAARSKQSAEVRFDSVGIRCTR